MTQVDRVHAIYDAFARGDGEAILAATHPTIDFRIPPGLPHSGHFHGHDGLRRFLEAMGGLWQTHSLRVERVFTDGDEVVVLGRGEGTLAATGTPAGYGFAHWFTFAGDQVTRFRELVDADEVLLAQMRVG